jgi:hypothetical protein
MLNIKVKYDAFHSNIFRKPQKSEYGRKDRFELMLKKVDNKEA